MKKIILMTIITGLFFACELNAQGSDILWTKTFGGTENDDGKSIQQTSDGGYIIAGTTASFGAGYSDVYLIKTNELGDTLWTRNYGGVNNDWGHSVQQTSDGGYAIVGGTYSFGAGEADVYFIKTNDLGDILWTKTFGGTNNDEGKSLQQTSDGGYIIGGYTYSFGAGEADVYFIKTDCNGDILWTNTYGSPMYECCESVQLTDDGGYIITGGTYSLDVFGDVWLIKTNAIGDTLWTKIYGGLDSDWGCSVQQTTDNGFIVAGRTQSFGSGSYDVYLIKTDESGDSLWTGSYGGEGGDWGASVNQTADGGYIVAGGTVSYGLGIDVFLVKTNFEGSLLWFENYGGNDYDDAYSVQQTSDDGYVIAGVTMSFGSGMTDAWLIKTSEESEPGSISGTVSLNGGTGNVDDILIIAEPGTYQTNPIGGNYTLVVPEGDYTVTASLDGYIPQTGENVYVNPGQVTNLDFTMEPINIVISPDSFYFETTGTANNIMNLQNQNNVDFNYQLSVSFEDDTEFNYDGLNIDGLGNFSEFGWAVRFTSDELIGYYDNGYKITHIKSFFYQTPGDNPVFKVWEGGSSGNPGTEVYSAIDSTYVIGDWTIHKLSTPIPLINNNEYWIGCTVSNVPEDSYPCGFDAGPGVLDKSFWVNFGDNWYDYVSYGFDHNLNIRAIVSKPWLDCNYDSGVIPSNENVDIDLMVDASELDFGDYYADIILDILPDLATYTIPVHLLKTLTIPPQNLFVTEEGYASWEAPVTKALLGYNVYLDGDSVGYTTDLFYQYEDLINGQTYIAGVSAVYDEGESNIIEFQFTFNIVLNPPQNLFVTEKAYATWAAPTSKDLLGYNVYLDDNFVEYTTELFYQYEDLIEEQTYVAGISAVYDEGESAIVEYEFTCIFTGVENNILPDTELLGNFPNPFNSSTTISFSVKDTDKNTNITIYNFNGQKIKTLVDMKLNADTHQIVWDCTDDSNNPVPTGIYFYKMKHGDKYTGFKKMIFMK